MNCRYLKYVRHLQDEEEKKPEPVDTEIEHDEPYEPLVEPEQDGFNFPD